MRRRTSASRSDGDTDCAAQGSGAPTPSTPTTSSAAARQVMLFMRLPLRRSANPNPILRAKPIVHVVLRERGTEPLRVVHHVHETMLARWQRHDNRPDTARSVAHELMRGGGPLVEASGQRHAAG